MDTHGLHQTGRQVSPALWSPVKTSPPLPPKKNSERSGGGGRHSWRQLTETVAVIVGVAEGLVAGRGRVQGTEMDVETWAGMSRECRGPVCDESGMHSDEMRATCLGG